MLIVGEVVAALVACPSPPWSGSSLHALLLLGLLLVACLLLPGQGTAPPSLVPQLLGFNPLTWFVGWCGGDVRTLCSPGYFGLAEWLVGLSSAMHYLQLLVQLGVVMLPAAHSVR
jgi:hypothetical protein